MELKSNFLNACDKATKPKALWGVGLVIGAFAIAATVYSGGTDQDGKNFEFTRYLENVGIMSSQP